MLLHLARISVITISVALVGLVLLLARPQAPTVITVVVPQAQPAATVVQPTYVHPYWAHRCNARVCWH